VEKNFYVALKEVETQKLRVKYWLTEGKKYGNREILMKANKVSLRQQK
jgi:hypothetical protein